jgi:1,4-alpha-glucan branching enzyme
MQQLVADLNQLYARSPALHRHEFEPEGFQWIDCNDREQSVLSFLRLGGGEALVVVLNFTPEPRRGYMMGVPSPGRYRVLLNSDSTHYGGANLGTVEAVANPAPWHQQPCALMLDLPPLGGMILVKDSS